MPLDAAKKQELSHQAQFHQGVGRILSNPQFSSAMDEIADNPQSRQAVLNDAAGYFKSKGVDIPGMGQGWTVQAHSSYLCITVCFFGWCWQWCPFGS